MGAMQSDRATDRRLKAFAYLVAEKASLYRAIMDAFTQAKTRFAVHLRPPEIVESLRAGQDRLPEEVDPEEIYPEEIDREEIDPEKIDQASVEAALSQLCEWGNLEAHPDTADVATVEEFYRPRYLYQITEAGEAVEQAVATYLEAIATRGELQAAALGDIGSLLGELEQLAGADEPDEGKVHRTLSLLRVRFSELTSRAQSFIASLQRTIDLQGIEIEALLTYKQRLIEYLERFIGELVLATAGISEALERIEAHGAGRLLAIAAHRDLADALEPAEADRAAARRLWEQRWAGLRAWFIRGTGQAPSHAEVLRSRARAAIPALLAAVAAAHDRRTTRSDRHTDLCVLARWFAETDSDRQAHRLWRAAFALAPARHLKVTTETLVQRDQSPVAPDTSWLEAPAIEISPRLRRTGRHTRRGRPANVIDRSDARAELERRIATEADQVEQAHQRVAHGRQIRLSRLGHLQLLELDLFLDLLGEALASRPLDDGRKVALSTDGRLRIVLEPTGDGTLATITTPAGRFSGADHLITITRTFEHDEQLSGLPAPAAAAGSADAAVGLISARGGR